jgi:hypothetical protein
LSKFILSFKELFEEGIRKEKARLAWLRDEKISKTVRNKFK